MPSTPTLHLIAGVNGAGKTSFYRYELESLTPGAEFVNADELARRRWPGDEDRHVPEAARLAAARRLALLDARATFVAETVFSHPSKLELVAEAKRRGFRVILYHVHVNSAALARARIRTRIGMGGHAVPDDRVDARFERSLALIPRAAGLADLTLVFDNSGAGRARTHAHVMTLQSGRITKLKAPLPDWVERAYREPIAAYRARGG
jgi:predicted ABC-type ATPase